MTLRVGALREIEPELPVEGERASHVLDDDPDQVEPRVHAGAVVRRPEAELGSDRLERLDHVRDVLVQVDPQQLRARVYLVPVHAGRERGLLELLLAPTSARAPSIPVGRTSPHAWMNPESSSQANSVFFSGVSRGIARCSACERIASMTSLGVSLLAQDRRAVLRVLVERRMDLVVEVVEEGRHAPQLLVLAGPARIPRTAASTASAWPQQRLALGVARECVPGLLAGGSHGWVRVPAVVDRSLQAALSEVVCHRGRPAAERERPRSREQERRPADPGRVVLADEPVLLSNIPRIRDVDTMVALLRDVGAEVEWTGPNEARVDATGAAPDATSIRCCAASMRASFLLAGPLLARFGRATVPPPGGDVIGRRRLDPHMHAFAELGASVEVGGGYEMSTRGLRGTQIFLDEASVMATENVVMAAVAHPGRDGDRQCRLRAARPGSLPLPRRARGADRGHRVERPADQGRPVGSRAASGGSGLTTSRSRASSALAAVTGGEVTIDGVEAKDLVPILPSFARLGVRVEVDGASVRVPADQELAVLDDVGGYIPKIEDGPWPAFPSDLTSIAATVATQASGTVLIFEKMFESRLFFTDKLVSMGARIILCDPHRVVITGPSKLRGQRMESPDIRAGMAMLLASLCADGDSTIGAVHQFDKGYERIDERLRELGAHIERVDV